MITANDEIRADSEDSNQIGDSNNQDQNKVDLQMEARVPSKSFNEAMERPVLIRDHVD